MYKQKRRHRKPRRKSWDQLGIVGARVYEEEPRDKDVWIVQGPPRPLVWRNASVTWGVGEMGQEKTAEKTAGTGAQREALDTMFNRLGLALEKAWNPLKRGLSQRETWSYLHLRNVTVAAVIRMGWTAARREAVAVPSGC